MPPRRTFVDLLNYTGMTDKEFSQLTGVSTRTIVRWVKEDSPVPVAPYFLALALVAREERSRIIAKISHDLDDGALDTDLTTLYQMYSQEFDAINNLLKQIGG